MSKPVIVVIAYNREKSLRRLLDSLDQAHFSVDEITLHISIDASDNPKVHEVAADFEWRYGEKVVVLQPENLGLKKHVFLCGGLTERYESIIVLEDDVVVAPGFYDFAQKGLNFYSQYNTIAGVSLFTYSFEENNFFPFQPIHDDSDVHFIQVASSWGQAWTSTQWSQFISWSNENPTGKEDLLPQYIKNWGRDSWKKLFISYMIDTNRYFVFPNSSYSTNFEDFGTNASHTGWFQVQLNLGTATPRFQSIDDSKSVYDVYFEIIPSALKRIVPQLAAYDFEVDLYGKKPLTSITSDFLLTTRKGRSPVKTFGSSMKPLVQNVIFNVQGSGISLIEKSNINNAVAPHHFMALSKGMLYLRQHFTAYSGHQNQVTVVIPATNADLLQITINELRKDRFYEVTVLIACNAALAKEFESLEGIMCCSLKWVHCESKDLNDLLAVGFDAVSTDYLSWVQAGMLIDLEKFERISKIFSGMAQVNFVRGIDERLNEKNYLTFNSAPYRWSPQTAYSRAEMSGAVSSELMVWRKSLHVEIKATLRNDFSNLFIELLKVTPLYVLVDQIGERNGIKSLHALSENDCRELLADAKFQAKKGGLLLMRPIFKFWFDRNVRFFRLFYKEMERLPLVIRYDFKHDNYFLDNF
jgi:hypothetical protein